MLFNGLRIKRGKKDWKSNQIKRKEVELKELN